MKFAGTLGQGDLLPHMETGSGQGKRAWRLAFLLSSPRGQAARYVKEHGHVVGDVMCDRVISIPEDMPLDKVADLMERRHLKRVPVLVAAENVPGIKRVESHLEFGGAIPTL